MDGKHERCWAGLKGPFAGALLGLGLAASLGFGARFAPAVAQVQEPAPVAPALPPPAAATAEPAPPTLTPGASGSAATAPPPAEPAGAAAAPPPPRPLAPPSEPVAAKAYGVLETHCARCHQGERLKRPAPAGAFGNILRLDEIAADPVLVRPGNPDASRLYTHMLRRLMPFDVHQEQSGGEEPSAEDMQAIRAWIGGLAAAKGCPDRRPVTVEDISAALVKQSRSSRCSKRSPSPPSPARSGPSW